jgi:hypothetical protein
MLRVQRRDIESEAVESAGSEVLHHDVGACHELVGDLDAVRVLEVERDAALAAVQPGEPGRLTVDDAVVVAGKVALTAAFDLDDVGAEVGEMARAKRRRDSLLEADNAQTGERKR